MPRGRRPKPITLHQLQGTYRKARHAGGAELERRLQVVPDYYCGLCGTHELPLAHGPTERAALCPACAVGATLLFREGESAALTAELFASVGLELVPVEYERTGCVDTPETVS